MRIQIAYDILLFIQPNIIHIKTLDRKNNENNHTQSEYEFKKKK